MNRLEGDSVIMQHEELVELFRNLKHSAFRLETLPQYLVEAEDQQFKEFLSGAKEPSIPPTEWCEWLTARKSEGKTLSCVHILPDELTPYLRFEIEWGYRYTAAAGQDVRLLTQDKMKPEFEAMMGKDFWLIDDETVVFMEYDSEGRYLFPRRLTDESQVERYRNLRDDLLANSIDFQSYWNSYQKG